MILNDILKKEQGEILAYVATTMVLYIFLQLFLWQYWQFNIFAIVIYSENGMKIYSWPFLYQELLKNTHFCLFTTFIITPKIDYLLPNGKLVWPLHYGMRFFEWCLVLGFKPNRLGYSEVLVPTEQWSLGLWHFVLLSLY